MASFFGIQRNQTFKPKRNVPPGTRQSLLKRYAEATLGSGNLRNAVKLPPGEDRDEWLALHSTSLCYLSMYSTTDLPKLLTSTTISKCCTAH